MTKHSSLMLLVAWVCTSHQSMFSKSQSVYYSTSKGEINPHIPWYESSKTVLIICEEKSDKETKMAMSKQVVMRYSLTVPFQKRC